MSRRIYGYNSKIQNVFEHFSIKKKCWMRTKEKCGKLNAFLDHFPNKNYQLNFVTFVLKCYQLLRYYQEQSKTVKNQADASITKCIY